MIVGCHGCAAELPYDGRGRPPKWCKRCHNENIAAKQRAYYEQNRDEIAAKQRAYYEQNRDEIAAKKRAYYEQNRDEIAAKKRAYREQKLGCSVCGERLRHPSDDGLCGFCAEELAA
ncbi:MAG TPA: hypothetical protein VFF79_12650 [Conexibacter sp.]|nr:hypothetical protein [Conexibacter sp.]